MFFAQELNYLISFLIRNGNEVSVYSVDSAERRCAVSGIDSFFCRLKISFFIVIFRLVYLVEAISF